MGRFPPVPDPLGKKNGWGVDRVAFPAFTYIGADTRVSLVGVNYKSLRKTGFSLSSYQEWKRFDNRVSLRQVRGVVMGANWRLWGQVLSDVYYVSKKGDNYGGGPARDAPRMF